MSEIKLNNVAMLTCLIIYYHIGAFQGTNQTKKYENVGFEYSLAAGERKFGGFF